MGLPGSIDVTIKINEINHLERILEKMPKKNVFKNKDLQCALKVMGELEVPIVVRTTRIGPTIAGLSIRHGELVAQPCPQRSHHGHTTSHPQHTD